MKYKILTSETVYEEIKKSNLKIEYDQQECNLSLAKKLKAKFSFIIKVRKANKKYYTVIELYRIKDNVLIDGFKESFTASKKNRMKRLSNVIEKNIFKFKSKLLQVKFLVNKKISNKKISSKKISSKKISRLRTTLSDLKKYYLGNSSKDYSKSLKKEYSDVLFENNVIYSLLIVAGITFTISGLVLLKKAKEDISSNQEVNSIIYRNGEKKKVVSSVFLFTGLITIITSVAFSLECNNFIKNVYENKYFLNENKTKTCLYNSNKMNRKLNVSVKDSIRFNLKANRKSLQGLITFKF